MKLPVWPEREPNDLSVYLLLLRALYVIVMEHRVRKVPIALLARARFVGGVLLWLPLAATRRTPEPFFLRRLNVAA